MVVTVLPSCIEFVEDGVTPGFIIPLSLPGNRFCKNPHPRASIILTANTMDLDRFEICLKWRFMAAFLIFSELNRASL
jgi:hypothetical protein